MSLNFINFQRSRYVRFGSKADMCSATRDVRYVPIADIALNTGRLGTMPFGFWFTERMLSLVIWKT
jgi:hypothetical protein